MEEVVLLSSRGAAIEWMPRWQAGRLVRIPVRAGERMAQAFRGDGQEAAVLAMRCPEMRTYRALDQWSYEEEA